jgi:predicted DNA-binding ribbon-helix-helix protein
MKNNLEAKFYDTILKATKKELPTIERIEIIVDKNIDNPSNISSVDCGEFLKQNNKINKAASVKNKKITNI